MIEQRARDNVWKPERWRQRLQEATWQGWETKQSGDHYFITKHF